MAVRIYAQPKTAASEAMADGVPSVRQLSERIGFPMGVFILACGRDARLAQTALIFSR